MSFLVSPIIYIRNISPTLTNQQNSRTLACRSNGNVLSNLKLGWVDSGVQGQKLTGGGSVLGSKVEEDVARLDGVRRDSARRTSTDGNIDDLTHKDQIWVCDLRVCSDQSGKRDLVVSSNGGKSITADDDVETWSTEDACCGRLGCRGEAGCRVWETNLGGDGENGAKVDYVHVGDRVCFCDVADSTVVLCRDGS